MWCIKCQADVAAEMAPDNRRILCASCGSQIRTVPLLAAEDKTRQARELLERWSKKEWSEESEKPASNPRATLAELSAERKAETAPSNPDRSPIPAETLTNPVFRVDESHPDHHNRKLAENAGLETPVQKPPVVHVHQPHVVAAQDQPPARHRTDDAHATAAPAPHFASQIPGVDEGPITPSTSSKLQSFWGQMLAYVGVLALTIGAAFVLLGYFGGPEWQSYTPTGWLITTTGQMLLFLGVVTLVSGGMEQTTEEVARRIDRLGQRMIRIEWASQNHALKGPSIPAENFQPGADTTKKRQTADVANPVIQDERR